MHIDHTFITTGIKMIIKNYTYTMGHSPSSDELTWVFTAEVALEESSDALYPGVTMPSAHAELMSSIEKLISRDEKAGRISQIIVKPWKDKGADHYKEIYEDLIRYVNDQY